MVIHQQVSIGQQCHAVNGVEPCRRADAIDFAGTVQQASDRGHLTARDLTDAEAVQFADIHCPVRGDDDAGGVVEGGGQQRSIDRRLGA